MEAQHARALESRFVKELVAGRVVREPRIPSGEVRDVYRLVEYLYESAVWTQQNSGHRGRRLPRRGIRQINDAVALLRRIGTKAVTPLVESVRVYDKYGDPDDDLRTLYFTIVFDTLEKMGVRAAEGLRDLARMSDKTISVPARAALGHLVDRGLLESTGLRGRGPRR